MLGLGRAALTPSAYFQPWYAPLTVSLFPGVMSYVLCWTIVYTIVHVYP